MEIFLHGETWIALVTLIFLEIVLGVDNIIFISIISNKLPEHKRGRARTAGLSMALIFRIVLLFGITWLIGFSKPLFVVAGFEASARDLILAIGGLFLLAKSTTEIHNKMEGTVHEQAAGAVVSAASVIVQVALMDMIFSLDSILTAVGLTDHVMVMVIAVVIALVIMMIFAGMISEFIGNHPTLEVLALSFLILIGFMLVLDGLHFHVPKGYIYFAVFFSLLVEMINMRMRKRGQPVQLVKRFGE